MHLSLSKSQAQEMVWQFIHEFRDRLVTNFSNLMDFIIIYGSAVRGEFVPGKSDVDILIQIFKKEDKVMIEKVATEIFWELAKKYPVLEFEKSLSISEEKKNNFFTQLLEKAEKANFLYVPVFVFVQGEIDWKNGELHTDNPLLKAGQKLLVPQRTVFLRFKQEGKILFGRDVRKQIKVHLTWWDRLRLGFVPQLLSFIGFLIALMIPGKARSYSVKALLYQMDALIAALSRYEKMAQSQKVDKAQKLLLNEFTQRLQKMVFLKLDHTKGSLRPRDFELLQEAIQIKWGEKKLSYFATMEFTWRALFFIFRSNIRALGLMILRRR